MIGNSGRRVPTASASPAGAVGTRPEPEIRAGEDASVARGPRTGHIPPALPRTARVNSYMVCVNVRELLSLLR